MRLTVMLQVQEHTMMHSLTSDQQSMFQQHSIHVHSMLGQHVWFLCKQIYGHGQCHRLSALTRHGYGQAHARTNVVSMGVSS